MATKKLLTNGNAFKRTDGRWGECHAKYKVGEKRRERKPSGS